MHHAAGMTRLPCFNIQIYTPYFGNDAAIRSPLYASAVGASSGVTTGIGSERCRPFHTSWARGGMLLPGRVQRISAPSEYRASTPASSSIHWAETTVDECGRRATSLYVTLSQMRIEQSAPNRCHIFNTKSPTLTGRRTSTHTSRPSLFQCG
jgi:hypothetical protein